MNRRAILRSAVHDVSLQPLESRVLFDSTPSSVLTLGMRKDLLAAWNGPDKSTLTADLAAGNPTQFDSDLLSYMQTRTNAQFYFQPSDVANYISYIQQNINTSDITTRANELVNHLFPATPGSSDYTTQLPAGDVNWLGTTQGDTNLYQALNRQAFWQDLSTSYRLTGNSNYSTELTNELASWTAQNPALTDANSWPQHTPSWALLDTSIRASSWTWAYSLMIGTSGWTAQANSLFLYKMEQTGDFLKAATPFSLADNRAVIQYGGLLSVADLFPEFSNAASWSSYGHTQLFKAMGQQIYADGSDREQSPGYDSQVINQLLDTKQLDQLNGYNWPSAQSTSLTTAITAYEQMLSPNGDRAAIGDTYRAASAPLWLQADLVQNTTAFPAAKPRINDVWQFGPTVAQQYMSNPVNPALPDRGTSFELPDAGDYMMRSGSDSNARQIIFEAGPKGGEHGHYDLFNFELSGYGKPLISDPGLVRYDTSADRTYAISTPAHNTISADGMNVGDIEGVGNPAVVVDQWDPESDHTQVTAHHTAYSYLSGSPTLSRSIWYDNDGTMLVVDWANGSAAHNYSVGFNLPGSTQTNSDGSIQSTNGNGDVKITPILMTGQSTKAVSSFVSNTSSPDESPATHYSINENGKFVAFVTLVTTYNGSTAPDTTASLISTPTAAHSFAVQLTKNGVAQTVNFTPPHQTIPNKYGTVSSSSSSIAYDSKGTLYMAYYDPKTGHLDYTTRNTSGVWSAVQLVDNSPSAGLNPSIAIDGNGRPGIAYYDGLNTSLKYAYLDSSSNSWQLSQVDTAGTVGQYPSLAFSRKSGAVISYYDKTHHSLKLATTITGGWTLQTIDKSADVGKYSSLSLDPSRPTASKWAISYDDSTHGSVKYAVQAGSGYSIYTVDSGGMGGISSLAFDSSNLPAITYYDSKQSALKLARFSAKAKTFSSSYVASAGTVGQASSLFFSKKGVATVFYTDATHHRLVEATQKGAKWIATALKSGGTSVDVARYGTSLAYVDGSTDGTLTSTY